MFTPSIKTRLLALFVILFICLNAGGTMCVAYCRTASKLVESEHCPLKRTADHCNRSKANTRDSVVANKLECCSMTLTFIGGPIQNFAYSFVSVEQPAAISHQQLFFRTVSVEEAVTAHPYRGPPPIDRRTDRIRNRIIRI